MFEGFEQTLLTSLLEVSVKAGLLALLAHLVLRLVRPRSASMRFAVWGAVLAIMVAWPLTTLLLPSVPVPAPLELGFGAGGGGGGTIPPPAAALEAPVSLAAASAPLPATTAGVVAPPVGSTSLPWKAALVWLYVVGVALMASRIALALALGRRLVATGRPIASEAVTGLARRFAAAGGSARAPEVLESAAVRVPLTVGYVHCRVLLPSDWRNWSEDKLASVLAHEIAHVCRRDLWTHLMAALNRCLYWFHPVAWILPGRLAALAEQSCDALAVRWTGDGRGYARHLVEVASAMEGRSGRLLLAGAGVPMASGGGDLHQRIRSIIDGRDTATTADRRSARSVVLAILVLGVLISVVRLDAGQDFALNNDSWGASLGEDMDMAVSAAPQREVEREVEHERKSASPARQREEIGGDKEPANGSATPKPKRGASRPALSAAEATRVLADLGSGDPLVRARGAVAVRRAGNAPADVVEPLAAMLGDHTRFDPADLAEGRVPDRVLDDGTTRPGLEAAWALGKLGDAGVDALTDALGSSDWQVRADAAFGLGHSRSPTAEAALRATDESDARVRSWIDWSLGRYDRQNRRSEAALDIESLLGSDDPAERSRAVQALGSQRSAEAADRLVSALSDDAAEVRAQAAWALGMALPTSDESHDAAVDALVYVLADPSPAVRDKAVWALGRVGDRSRSHRVEELLADDSAEVRANAAWALGMLEAASARPSLEQALEDDDPAVRERAAWALRHLDD